MDKIWEQVFERFDALEKRTERIEFSLQNTDLPAPMESESKPEPEPEPEKTERKE